MLRCLEKLSSRKQSKGSQQLTFFDPMTSAKLTISKLIIYNTVHCFREGLGWAADRWVHRVHLQLGGILIWPLSELHEHSGLNCPMHRMHPKHTIRAIIYKGCVRSLSTTNRNTVQAISHLRIIVYASKSCSKEHKRCVLRWFCRHFKQKGFPWRICWTNFGRIEEGA